MAKYLTQQQLVQHAANLNVSDLQASIRRYLYEGRFGDNLVLSRSSRHIVVSELYAASNYDTKETLERAFSIVLESLEPSEPPRKEEIRYVFHLLSLAASIKPPQAKERLRRWLYINAFEGWQYGPFNLHAQLVLATAAYDSDEQWVYWLKNVLPTRPSFADCARATYRALWQTRNECLSLLPEILIVADLSNPRFAGPFRYLLGLTVDGVGARAFCSEVIAVLNKMSRPVAEVFTIILQFRDIIADGVPITDRQMDRVTKFLRGLWDSNAERWLAMNSQEAYDAFAQTVEAAGPERCDVLPSHFKGQGVLQVVIFSGEYSLQIEERNAELIERCEPFFEEGAMAAAG